MEQDNQQQFIAWLAQKLKVKDQNEFKGKLQELGEDGIRQAYDVFLKEQNQVQSAKDGAKLDYIKCLQAFKKGGKAAMDKCGCGGKVSMEKGGTLSKKEYAREDQGRKDHTGKTTVDKGKTVNKKGDRKDQNKANKAGAGQWMEKGDKHKHHTGLGGIKSHQQGGVVASTGLPYGKTNLMVTKADGTVGPWGNDLKANANPKQYILSPSQVSNVQQINPAQLQHLQGAVPNFNNVVGQPQAAAPGQVQRYGADQSDIIRKLLLKFPMTPPQMTQQTQPQQKLATLSEGGILSEDTPFSTFNQSYKLPPTSVGLGQGRAMIEVKDQGGAIGEGIHFTTSKQAKKLTPHTVVMGQGAATVTSRKEGGWL